MNDSPLFKKLNDVMDDYIEDHLFDEGQAAHVQAMLSDAISQAERYADDNTQ